MARFREVACSPSSRVALFGALLALSACVPADDRAMSICRPSGGEAFRPGAVTVAAVGDVLMHAFLQQDAAEQPGGFSTQLAPAAPFLRMADITVANLEGPAARGVLPGGGERALPPGVFYDGTVYSGYPAFNFNPSILPALAGAGVDVVQTANNHAMDRGPLGVDRTLEALDAAELARTGTRARGETGPWHAVVSAEGYRIAFLACSYSTNGRADPDRQVLLCYRDEGEVLSTLRDLTADPEIDATILLPHWGSEDSETPDANQRRLARAALEAGAAAVIGTHPHVLQPLEILTTSDGRRGVVAYSLGNFISSQWRLNQRSSVILYLDLLPGPNGLEAQPPAWLPTRVTRYINGTVVQAAEEAVDGEQSIAHVARILGTQGMLSPGELVSGAGCGPS